jgi:hypothetical protein
MDKSHERRVFNPRTVRRLWRDAHRCDVWVSRAPDLRAQANATLLPLITQAHQESWPTYGPARTAIFERIEVFYNHVRLRL